MPARVAHSPQRFKDTIGLVIERQRLPHELDCLRWYTSLKDESSEILFERWFHCFDLTQLKPVIQEFVTSSEFTLQRPGPGSFLRKAVFEEPSDVVIHQPISLVEMLKLLLQKNSLPLPSSLPSVLNNNNTTTGWWCSLFPDMKSTSSVNLYGPGKHAIEYPYDENGCDLFLLQLVRSFLIFLVFKFIFIFHTNICHFLPLLLLM